MRRFLTHAPFDRKPGDTSLRKLICRWCGKDVKPPRRSWCSQECVDHYLIRSSPAEVRRQIVKRDHGVCALCRFDCEGAEDLNNRWRRVPGLTAREQRGLARELFYYLKARGFRITGPPERWHNSTSLWEADHIVPVAEGGGQCDLSNYRTLCQPCHRAETTALQRRLGHLRTEARKLRDFERQLLSLRLETPDASHPCPHPP